MIGLPRIGRNNRVLNNKEVRDEQESVVWDARGGVGLRVVHNGMSAET